VAQGVCSILQKKEKKKKKKKAALLKIYDGEIAASSTKTAGKTG
jgi:hypothetical protein